MRLRPEGATSRKCGGGGGLESRAAAIKVLDFPQRAAVRIETQLPRYQVAPVWGDRGRGVILKQKTPHQLPSKSTDFSCWSSVVRNKGHLAHPQIRRTCSSPDFLVSQNLQGAGRRASTSTQRGAEAREGAGCKQHSPVLGAVVKIADDDEKRAWADPCSLPAQAVGEPYPLLLVDDAKLKGNRTCKSVCSSPGRAELG